MHKEFIVNNEFYVAAIVPILDMYIYITLRINKTNNENELTFQVRDIFAYYC
jgi:hypothetical protein